MNFSSVEITQIIVAVIVQIGLIFQGIITYKVSKAENDKTKNSNKIIVKIRQTANKNPKKYKFTSLTIAFILLLTAVPGTKIFYTKQFIEPYITVYSPKPNASVDTQIDINGGYRNINIHEQLIWIAVYSNFDRKYFIHNCPADINPLDKTWANDNTIIGLAGDKNEKYRILFLLINKDSECHKEILNYINDESHHGLDRLPNGNHIIKDITVFIK